MDNHTKEQRRKNMQAIKCRDTRIEILLRKELWKRGYRYRKNYPKAAGKPDVVFVKQKIAVFCDGEFWHGYNWNERKKDIKSNQEYWIDKIERNMKRDSEVNKELESSGWRVLRFWEKDLLRNMDQCVEKIEKEIASKPDTYKIKGRHD